MIRFAALLVAASVLAASLPAQADGVPLEKRSTVTRKVKKKRVVRRKLVTEKKIVVEKKEAPPVVVAPVPPPPPAPAYVWMAGHWTWNAPMNTHVWVPGMYVWPTSPAEEQSLALWRLGKWIGISRDD